MKVTMPCLLAAAVASFAATSCSRAPASAAAEPKLIAAEARQLSSSATAYGTVLSAKTSAVKAQSGGRVDRIHVKSGDYVKPGDLMAEISNPRIARHHAEQLGSVRSCEWVLKKRELERDSKEGAERAIAETEVEVARVELESARRKLETAQEQVDNCTVRAVYEGKVMSVDVKEGDLVSGSSDYSLGSNLFQIIGTDHYLIEVLLGEIEAARIDPRTRAEVRLPALMGEVFGAEIQSASQAARRGERGAVFPLLIAFSTQDARVKLGMSAEVKFVLAVKEASTALPLSHVHFDDEGAYVTVDTEGARERRRVKLGLNDANFVEIAAGLKEGELVAD